MAKVHGIRITVTSGRQIAHDMYEWQCHGWHLKISIFQENLTSVITYYLIIIGQVYGAVIMNKSLQEFLSSSNECRTPPSGCRPKWLPTLGSSQSTWTVSLPASCYHIHPPPPYNIPVSLSCTEAVQAVVVYSERSAEAKCSAVKPSVWRGVPRSWVVEQTQVGDVRATVDSALHHTSKHGSPLHCGP